MEREPIDQVASRSQRSNRHCRGLKHPTGLRLRARTAASTLPSMTWVFSHAGFLSVVDGTCLGST